MTELERNYILDCIGKLNMEFNRMAHQLTAAIDNASTKLTDEDTGVAIQLMAMRSRLDLCFHYQDMLSTIVKVVDSRKQIPSTTSLEWINQRWLEEVVRRRH